MSKSTLSRPACYVFCMRQREYGQYCGLARAMDLVGERWALLIIRDLLVRPRRYSDLHAGLPGIPTNVLSTRLKELEAAGVIERQLLPAPERGVVYALTERGHALDDAVLRLARWGAAGLGDPRPNEVVTADSLVMALRSTFRPDAAVGLDATWQLEAGDIVLHAQVQDGELNTGVGPAGTKPDLVIAVGDAEGPPPLKALMTGELSPDEAVGGGWVRLTGRRRLLKTFAEVFRI
jgi:DNA-binding HxlR family transcriptional regulator